ncbi:TonB-dependent siderophore receptor [Caulobacter sp. LARHSG274]
MSLKNAFRTSVSAAVLFAATGALAQTAAPASSSNPEAVQVEEVVVTGVTAGTRKKDATFSINTLTTEEIQRLAPISTADLLANIPGLYTEGSSAGEASNNVTVRGLPVTGGYRYAPQLIDGLPVYEEPEVQFMNNDVFIRTDLMTDRVEVVKGGPGGILYSNGLGATVNYVTKTGGQKFEGGYRLEVADYGFVRNEAFVSGPINKNLTFALGGFYRVADGIRDNGYTGDHGGQIRGNIVYTSDDGATEIQAHALFLNDHTAFYQNLPISVPRLSGPGTADDPTKIDQDTIEPLGIDFAHGTVASPFNRHFTQMGEYGQRDIDLADGIHPKFNVFTLKFSREMGDGWTFKGGLRYTSGTSDFNTMFTGNDTAYAKDFLNVRLQNDVISPAHGAALSCNLNNAKLRGFFNVPTSNPCAAFAGISREDFIANYSKVARVQGYYLDNGQAVAPDTYLNFLLPFIANVKADSASMDLQVQKTFNWLGEHKLTAGGYGSSYTYDANFQASLLVSSMGEPSRLVDLRGLDANGAIVGPSLTSGGAILPGFFGFVTDSSSRGYAAYLQDHWETLDNRLKLDLGVRWQTLKTDLVRRDRNVLFDATPASVVVGSTQDTTADNELSVPGAPRYLDKRFSAVGWSVGANYSISDPIAVYGLVSRSFRLPSLEDLNEFRVDTTQQVGSATIKRNQIERIWQLETGLRYYKSKFDASAAVYYNKFTPRDFVNVYRDFQSPQCAVTGAVPQINTCPEVGEVYQRGVKNFGAEVELAWRPIDGLELKGAVTVQDPKITNANYKITREVRDAANVLTGYEYVEIGEDGRRPRRLPTVMVNFTPSFDFRPLTGVPVSVFGQVYYYSSRFSESTDFNVTQYPAYYIVNAGAAWAVTPNLMAQFNVANLTNQLSFTEGDPIFSDLLSPDGARNRGVARPLFGRTYRASLTYRF